MKFKQGCARFIKKHDITIVRVLILMLFSLSLTLLTEWVVRGSFISAVNWIGSYPYPFFFTSIFFFFISFFLFTIMRRIDFPILILGIVDLGLSAASYFKSSYRSEPLYPWDLGIVSEAADISSEMQLVPTAAMYTSFGIVLGLFALLLTLHIVLFKNKLIPKAPKTKRRRINVSIQAVVSFAVLSCYLLFVLNNSVVMDFFGIKESAFRQAAACRRNGFVQSFVMNTKYILPEKPNDYNMTSVSEAVSEIKTDSFSDEKVKPNIIYLMSESYADISLCENVTYYDDIFGATNFLKEHYVSGTLLGAQFGGGTCNSEFEVLTGFSMANLPAGCTPYQQYFNTETVSYPRFLKELGYNTVAIHSYGKQFWNRDVAYPNMGFDKFLAEEDFVDPLRRRGLIKDDELVKMIIREYEANLETGKPFFNFSVSMQNHGSFTDGQYLEDYRARLSCDELSSEQQGILITYATGIRDANIALDKLINYFSSVNEPTIICMFGDHLGSLGGSDEIYMKSGYMGDPEKSATDMAKKYTTPFFIWDNFTDLNFTAPRMSFYQLIPSVCQWYDLDKPLFFDYLLEQQSSYRGTALGLYLDTNGEASYEIDEDSKSWLEKHRLLQYDLMFGKGYCTDKLYSASGKSSLNK